MMDFAELQGVQTRVVFFRHVEHAKNMLTALAKDSARLLGSFLPQIEAAYTSPEPRAVETAQAICKGNDSVPLLRTLEGLSAMRSESADIQTELDKDARKAGKEGAHGDEIYQRVILSEKWKAIRIRRAREGADSIGGIAVWNKGKTVLAVSHGIFRIEPTMACLLGEEECQPLEFLAPGEGYEIVLGINDLISIRRLSLQFGLSPSLIV